MNVLDLFSGIGGFSLGLERAGMRTVAFCEIDPFCRRVLAKHWPGVPIHHDITKLRGSDVGPVDVICGGFPCQDISQAGLGAGIGGERSGLWRDYARIIGEVRPRYVIVENVAALLFRGLGNVLGDLAALGYDAEWHCIPASAIGAPHQRDRIWIVAYAAGERCGEARRLRLGKQEEWPASGPEKDGFAPHSYSDGLERWEQWPSARFFAATVFRSFWQGNDLPKPCIRRGDDGFPARVDRLRSLGNAVVPQIPEIIGRAIMSVNQ
jgi:DNA (cytosine-5)-methyltransferase 1